jgi:hypothetical protein
MRILGGIVLATAELILAAIDNAKVRKFLRDHPDVRIYYPDGERAP